MRDILIVLAFLSVGFVTLGLRATRPTIDYKRALAASSADRQSLSYAFAKALQAEREKQKKNTTLK